ncbi:MAG TPA: hypothetical protein VFG22_19415 [Polyangiales bacterium]|nr:hypothetical protein [Polyangiales bacterium]
MISFGSNLSRFAALVVLASGAGCIKAPPIAVVDNRTAIEVQASGEYPDLEFQSADATLQPGPSPVSGKDIVSKAGLSAAGADLDLFELSRSDAQLIDAMLLIGCLGEGEDGLLKYTPDRCDQNVEVSELLRVAGRNNLHRRQVWEYLASRRPDQSAVLARDAWRSVHLEQVRCGAWIEKDGAWAQKTC